MKRLLIIGMLLMTGCVSSIHCIEGRLTGVDNGVIVSIHPTYYHGTCEMSKAFLEIWNEYPQYHGGSIAEAEFSHSYCILFSPFIIIDLPLELVFDTVMLPWDIVNHIIY